MKFKFKVKRNKFEFELLCFKMNIFHECYEKMITSLWQNKFFSCLRDLYYFVIIILKTNHNISNKILFWSQFEGFLFITGKYFIKPVIEFSKISNYVPMSFWNVLLRKK